MLWLEMFGPVCPVRTHELDEGFPTPRADDIVGWPAPPGRPHDRPSSDVDHEGDAGPRQ